MAVRAAACQRGGGSHWQLGLEPAGSSLPAQPESSAATGKVLLLSMLESRASDSMKSVKLMYVALRAVAGRAEARLALAAISRQLQRGSLHQLLTVDLLEAAMELLLAGCVLTRLYGASRGKV